MNNENKKEVLKLQIILEMIKLTRDLVKSNNKRS